MTAATDEGAALSVRYDLAMMDPFADVKLGCRLFAECTVG
jgi:hypothetical protein